MNKTLRQLFTAVIVLFVILGISSSIIMVNRANRLSHDSRNTRALYQTYGAPRGSILASDGTIIAKSDPVNDSFSYQRSYPQGDIYAPITGYFSIAQNADRGIEASENELLTGESNALFWQHVKALFTGKENKGASIETSIDPKLQTAAMEALKNNDGAAVAIEPKTGRILAMASTPSYDPNELASHDTGSVSKAYTELVTNPSNPMLNRAISELYPPGVHIQDGRGGGRARQRQIPARHADSGRRLIHAAGHADAADERRGAGQRHRWQDLAQRRHGVVVEHRIRAARRGPWRRERVEYGEEVRLRQADRDRRHGFETVFPCRPWPRRFPTNVATTGSRWLR